MAIIENSFIVINEEKGTGVALDDYSGVLSVVKCYQRDWKIYQNWGKPQIGKDKYSDKSLPWKIEIGDQHEAAGILRRLADRLDGGQGSGPAESVKEEDIPF